MLAHQHTRASAATRTAADAGPEPVSRMLKSFLLMLLSVAAFAATAVPPDAHAARRGEWLAQRGDDGGGMSLNQAVQQVQRDTGGRVLSAETVGQGNRRVHRIKVLLPSGRVRVVTVDPGR